MPQAGATHIKQPVIRDSWLEEMLCGADPEYATLVRQTYQYGFYLGTCQKPAVGSVSIGVGTDAEAGETNTACPALHTGSTEEPGMVEAAAKVKLPPLQIPASMLNPATSLGCDNLLHSTCSGRGSASGWHSSSSSRSSSSSSQSDFVTPAETPNSSMSTGSQTAPCAATGAEVPPSYAVDSGSSSGRSHLGSSNAGSALRGGLLGFLLGMLLTVLVIQVPAASHSHSVLPTPGSYWSQPLMQGPVSFSTATQVMIAYTGGTTTPWGFCTVPLPRPTATAVAVRQQSGPEGSVALSATAGEQQHQYSAMHSPRHQHYPGTPAQAGAYRIGAAAARLSQELQSWQLLIQAADDLGLTDVVQQQVAAVEMLGKYISMVRASCQADMLTALMRGGEVAAHSLAAMQPAATGPVAAATVAPGTYHGITLKTTPQEVPGLAEPAAVTMAGHPLLMLAPATATGVDPGLQQTMQQSAGGSLVAAALTSTAAGAHQPQPARRFGNTCPYLPANQLLWQCLLHPSVATCHVHSTPAPATLWQQVALMPPAAQDTPTSHGNISNVAGVTPLGALQQPSEAVAGASWMQVLERAVESVQTTLGPESLGNVLAFTGVMEEGLLALMNKLPQIF